MIAYGKFSSHNTFYKNLFWGEEDGEEVGAEPTCSCTQMGHLADLLKNKVNSQ